MNDQQWNIRIRKSIASLRYLVVGIGLGSLLALACTTAQSQGKPTKAPSSSAALPPPKSFGSGSKLPPSFSDRQAKQKPKSSGQGRPVEQQDVADAVLGSAMNHIWELADEHFHKGEYNHVIHLYAIINQGDPHNVEAYANSAWLYWSTDRTPASIDILKKGIEANPNTYYMYDELGQHYWLHLKDAVNAVPYLEKAVTFKDCTAMGTFHSLAFCYQKLNQWDKAVKTWQTAVNFANDPVAPIKLKQAEAQLAKQQGANH